MEVKTEQKDHHLCVQVSGQLDTLTSPELESKVNLSGIQQFELDLQKVDYVSSAGLRLISSFHKQMMTQKGKMVVLHLCPAVREVFDMVGYSAILNIQ